MVNAGQQCFIPMVLYVLSTQGQNFNLATLASWVRLSRWQILHYQKLRLFKNTLYNIRHGINGSCVNGKKDCIKDKVGK